MPAGRRPPSPVRRRGVVIGTAVCLALSAAVLWSVVRFAAENPDKANLDNPVFTVGRAERLAREIDERGPSLFQDPLSRGRGRNIYLQHLGDDHDDGWVAVEARLPDDPACTVAWRPARQAFVDCHGDEHPANGSGLTTYPASVTDGVVRVDLRRPERS